MAKKTSLIYTSLALVFCGVLPVSAGWETGTRVTYDSNVDRSVDNGQGDTYLTAYLSYLRESPAGESRLGWFGRATLEGTAYDEFDDLNYAMIALAPGVSYLLRSTWSVEAYPFLEAKAVKDSEQSAVAFGATLAMDEQITQDLYAGQYYTYRDSRADVEVYSFTEHVLGVFLGVIWNPHVRTEIGYQFSSGDSFRAVDTSSSQGDTLRGRGRGRRFSSAFDREVIREDVDESAVRFMVGIDWNKALFSDLAYTFTSIDGDIGSSTSHATSIGIGYRF